MKKRYWGLAILAAIIIAILIIPPKADPIELQGYLGGEKSGLLASTAFKEEMADEHQLTFDYKILGSYKMVQTDYSSQDYLFPSSQLALELFERGGGTAVNDEIIFNTPIVLYSRKPIVDALMQEGIVSEREGVYYVDMEKLARKMADGVSWQAIGLSQLHGNLLVDTTDPNESNSGNMFLGVLANALNGNQTVNMSTVANIEEDLKKIYDSLGYMQTSSSDMFTQFLRQGIGAFPIIAGYESQWLEFSKQEPEVYSSVKDDIYMLYPEPTVWSSHVYIALNEEAERGIDALLDPDIQEMAWKEHGFRTIVSGSSDPDEFDVNGLADEITQIIPMPDIETMLYLMDIIQ